MKRKMSLFLVLFCLAIILNIGFYSFLHFNKKATAIEDIAYDNSPNNYTVYILENDKYVPYIVLTSDYNNNTLLLRQDIIEYSCTYNDNGKVYYPDSNIDLYLNSIFLNSFAEKFRKKIIDSEIRISPQSIISDETDGIQRKVFLLSATEASIRSDFCYEEGKVLKYFKKPSNRIAYRNNLASSWCLRSTYTADSGLVWYISSSGSLGGASVQFEKGIRPAFCVDSKSEIQFAEIDNNQYGYIFADDK